MLLDSVLEGLNSNKFCRKLAVTCYLDYFEIFTVSWLPGGDRGLEMIHPENRKVSWAGIATPGHEEYEDGEWSEGGRKLGCQEKCPTKYLSRADRWMWLVVIRLNPSSPFSHYIPLPKPESWSGSASTSGWAMSLRNCFPQIFLDTSFPLHSHRFCHRSDPRHCLLGLFQAS